MGGTNQVIRRPLNVLNFIRKFIDMEINFSIMNSNKLLENEDDLEIMIYTNQFMNTSDNYVVTVY